ncbi:hypothetical protein H1R20_g4867, partial [Candolleomyces eurysporus]
MLTSSSIPSAPLVANDSDNKRTHLLIHQSARLPSLTLMVTNLDASNYPVIRVPAGLNTKDHASVQALPQSDKLEPLMFDRILCDVPCSGDSTMRKNIMIWKLDGNGLHSLQVRIPKTELAGLSSRTVNASLYNMFVQASGIISSNIYRKDDAPMYRRGNRWLIGVCAFNCFILYPGVKAYYIWRNRSRDQIWDAMTSEQKSEYLATTKDRGNRRLDFRFAH